MLVRTLRTPRFVRTVRTVQCAITPAGCIDAEPIRTGELVRGTLCVPLVTVAVRFVRTIATIVRLVAAFLRRDASATVRTAELVPPAAGGNSSLARITILLIGLILTVDMAVAAHFLL